MRVRPGSARFLSRVAQLFELHVVTFGTRLYAHTICAFLDDFVRDYRAAESSKSASSPANEVETTGSSYTADVEMRAVTDTGPRQHRPPRRLRGDTNASSRGVPAAAAAGSSSSSSLFAHRILSRNECIDPERKTPSLSALFPAEGALNLLCVIDDREQVWSGIANLVLVRPYVVPFVRAALEADVGDDYLDDLALFLERLHARFFETLELLNSADAPDAELLARTTHREIAIAGADRTLRVPDVRAIIAELRAHVLDGLSLVFSSVHPQPAPDERKHKTRADRSHSHRFARQLGAKVIRDVPHSHSQSDSAAAASEASASASSSSDNNAKQADIESSASQTTVVDRSSSPLADQEMADATQPEPDADAGAVAAGDLSVAEASSELANQSAGAAASNQSAQQKDVEPNVLIVTARYGTEKCRIGQRRSPPVACVTLEWLFECFFRARRLDPSLFAPTSSYDMAGLDSPEAYYARLYERKYLQLEDNAPPTPTSAPTGEQQPTSGSDTAPGRGRERELDTISPFPAACLHTIRSGAKPFPCLPPAETGAAGDADAEMQHSKQHHHKQRRKHKAPLTRRSVEHSAASASGDVDAKRLRLEQEKLQQAASAVAEPQPSHLKVNYCI